MVLRVEKQQINVEAKMFAFQTGCYGGSDVWWHFHIPAGTKSYEGNQIYNHRDTNYSTRKLQLYILILSFRYIYIGHHLLIWFDYSALLLRF
ncbi:putative basic proline-rich protein-like [Iris pallida]|uniref:Basic proline-rich protein-like n=1 Tax=Iris pallida TaxID=29817 RepID=A0AAX6FYD5_IRIPA|nr:putative basic proline-rich protein-like [Iris pallida]